MIILLSFFCPFFFLSFFSQVPRYAEENVLQRMMIEDCCVSDSPDISKQIVKEKLKKNSIKCLQCYETGSSFEQTKIGVLNTKKNHGISKQRA